MALLSYYIKINEKKVRIKHFVWEKHDVILESSSEGALIFETMYCVEIPGENLQQHNNFL